MPLKKSVIVILLAVCAFSSLALWQKRAKKVLQPPERLRFGFALQPTSALAIIAQEKGFFLEQGLEVEPSYYSSGKLAMEALFSGQADIVTTQDVPFVVSSFEREDFSIIATIAYADSIQRIVCRKDSGIMKPRDLKGKAIMTQKGSAVHYFLHLFLLHHDIRESDVKLIFAEPADFVRALDKGEADAFCMREPYISEAERAMGDNAITFSERGVLHSTDNMVAMNSFIKGSPQAVEKAVRALIMADRFTKKNPSQAVRIISDRLGSRVLEMSSIWGLLDLEVKLRQILFMGLEDIARWAISAGLTKTQKIPDYLDYIYIDALSRIEPEAVTVIH